MCNKIKVILNKSLKEDKTMMNQTIQTAKHIPWYVKAIGGDKT